MGLDSIWTGWGLTEATLSRLGFVLPFVTFVGGLAVSMRASRRAEYRLLVVVLPLLVVAYIAGTWLSPEAEYRLAVATGTDVEAGYPVGAYTPRGYVRLSQAVELLSPPTPAVQTDNPFLLPPNWISYQLWLPAALFVFGVVNALLGVLAAEMTYGLSPSRRRHARWGIGLLVTTAYFGTMAAGASWVRADPAHSVALGVWGPLAAPLLLLVIGYRFAHKSRPGLHESSATSV